MCTPVHLDGRRIQHDANTMSHGRSGQVRGELGADGALAAVRARYLAPDGADLGFLGLVAGGRLVPLGLSTGNGQRIRQIRTVNHFELDRLTRPHNVAQQDYREKLVIGS